MVKSGESRFVSEYRVYYEDTDCGGVVYHANYLRFMERARSDWLRECGFAPSQALDKGLMFVVKEAQVEFNAPARLNDVLTVSVELADLGAASMVVLQRIHREGEHIASGTFRIACMDAEKFNICRLPDELKRRME